MLYLSAVAITLKQVAAKRVHSLQKPEDLQNPQKRRVLVVSQHFWPENFRINDIVDGFVKNGIEVDVLCGLPNYPSGEWFSGYSFKGPRRQQQFGAQIFRSGEIRRKNNTSLSIFLNYCSFPFFALFSLPRLAKMRYNAIFCYETSPVMMILPAIVCSRIFSAPLTAYVLDLWPDNLYSVLPIKSSFLRKIAKSVSSWHYGKCNKLVALSHQQAKQLCQMTNKNGKPGPKIQVIPQYSEDFYAEDVNAPELNSTYAGYFNILFAGNISPAQDLETLVRAVKRVLKSPNAPRVQVIILGDGMSKQALETLVKEEGLEDTFKFCGTVPAKDIPRFTGMANALFAGLSKSENLGMTVPAKIASYLAAGKPILLAMDGAGRQVAQESGAALSCAAADDAALAQNIIKLYNMPQAVRQKMGENGRIFYAKNYKRDILLKKLEDFIFED